MRDGQREGFLGGLYKAVSQNPASSALKENLDTIKCYYPTYHAELTDYSSEPMENGTERSLIQADYADGANLYCIFMGGDTKLAHIKSGASNGKSILVVRDSYGHAFLPFLANNYEHVYAVEPRYFQSFDLPGFVAANGIDELLFVSHSLPSTSHYWLSWPEQLAKLHKPEAPDSAKGQTNPPMPDSPSPWAQEQVDRAIGAGLVPQPLQSRYRQAATRAEFCALAVALYENLKGEIAGRKPFADTQDANVEKMAALGVVSGIDAQRALFSPDSQLTREQAATMLARLADAIGMPLPKKASDAIDKASFSSWSADAIGQVQDAGLMSSTDANANLFSPKGLYTREQSIATILRLYIRAH
jgi:hypothetical protein